MIPTVLLILILQSAPAKELPATPHFERRGEDTIIVVPKGWRIEIDRAYFDFEGKTLTIGSVGCSQPIYTIPTPLQTFPCPSSTCGITTVPNGELQIR